MRLLSRDKQVGDAIQAENVPVLFKAVSVTMKERERRPQSVDSEFPFFEAEFVLFHEINPVEIMIIGWIVNLVEFMPRGAGEQREHLFEIPLGKFNCVICYFHDEQRRLQSDAV
jgi:hypothetical protein